MALQGLLQNLTDHEKQMQKQLEHVMHAKMFRQRRVARAEQQVQLAEVRIQRIDALLSRFCNACLQIPNPAIMGMAANEATHTELLCVLCGDELCGMPIEDYDCGQLCESDDDEPAETPTDASTDEVPIGWALDSYVLLHQRAAKAREKEQQSAARARQRELQHAAKALQYVQAYRQRRQQLKCDAGLRIAYTQKAEADKQLAQARCQQESRLEAAYMSR